MGEAWKGNWWKRIYDRARAKGFPSLLAWTEHRPLGPYIDLAQELGPDVCAAQLVPMRYDEAINAGTHTLQRFLRASLFRQLHERLAFAYWRGQLRPAHKKLAEQIWDALEGRARRGWHPTGTNDPILLAAFESAGLG
jgi:hypothetical protein